VCVFFHVVEIVLDNSNEFGLNSDRFHALEMFSKLFEKYSDENDHPLEFIDTPAWTKITLMAKDVLRAFERNSSQ
jgi:hypothetical protein